MTRRKNRPKRTTGEEATGTKRKTISPLESAISQDTTHGTGLTGWTTQGQDEPVNTNKRLHISSPEYFTFDHNCATTDALSMAYQQNPYPQYMQSPPTYIQQGPTAPATHTPNSAMPPWASLIMEEMKGIKTLLSRIEPMEKTINVINTRFADLEIKVNDIDKRVIEVEEIDI